MLFQSIGPRKCIPRQCARPNCERTRMTFYYENGKRCPGCPVCIPVCVPRPCAFPRHCKKTKMTYYYVGKIRCPGCPVCVSQSNHLNPVPMKL